MSSSNFFNYPDPRQNELLKQCKVFIDNVQQSGEKKDLTISQRNFIAEVIKKKISLSTDKDHHLNIEIIDEAEFSVIIDGADKFHLIKKQQKEDDFTKPANKAVPVVVVQERIKTKSFVNSIRDFFEAIANLFYRPSYPSKELKQRTHKEAISQDYRALRKSLENGKQWLSSTGHIQMSSEQEEKRKRLDKEAGGLIGNGKKVEKALGSKYQQEALNRVSDEFAGRIYGLGVTGEDSVIIPTGYRNQDGVLQPVMLHFLKQNDKIVLEIYADTYEGTGKVSPLHKREFDADSTARSDIKAVLDEAFKPLTSRSSLTKAFKKAAKPSETFGAMTKSRIDPRLKEEINGITRKRETSEEVSEHPKEERVASLTFERFIRSVDLRMEGKWSALTVDDQKMKRQPGTPSERVVGWFNHLLAGQEGKLTKNEKLNLIFFMTEDYAQDQLRQLKRKPPLFKKPSPEKQLAVYKNVTGQVAHTRERLAISINGDHPLDTRGIPQSLKDTEAKCLERIATLENKILKSKRAGASKVLSQSHTSELFGVKVGSVDLEPSVEPSVVAAASRPLESLNETEWRLQWQHNTGDLKHLLSANQVIQQRERQIVIEVSRVQERNLLRLEDEQDVLENMIIKANKYSELTPEAQEMLIQGIINSPVTITADDKQQFTEALDAENKTEALNANHIQEIVSKFTDAALIEQQAVNEKQQVLAKVNLQELVENEKLNEEKLEALVKAFVNCMDQHVLAELYKNVDDINSTHFASIINQLIICPQMIPETSLNENKSTIYPQDYLPIIHQIRDPQLASGSTYSPIADDLRALLNIGHLLPGSQMSGNTEKMWKDQIKLRKENGEALIEQLLQKEIKNWKGAITRDEKYLATLEAKRENPEEDQDQIEARIADKIKTIQVNRVKIGIFEEIDKKSSFEDKVNEFDQQLNEIQNEISTMDGVEKKNADKKILEEALKDLEKKRTGEGFYTSIIGEIELQEQLDSLAEIPDLLSRSNLEMRQDSPDLKSLTIDQASDDLEKYQVEFTQTVNNLTSALNRLNKAAVEEPDPSKKQAMYEEIKTRSLELLSMLPPPGTEGAHGTPSLWRSLNAEQRADMRRNVQQLEQHVWEAQMRLSKTDLSGTEKFQMIKGQAIGMALVREDVKHEQENIEKFLTDLLRKNPSRLSEFTKMEGVQILENESRVIFNLKQMKPKLDSLAIKNLTKLVTETREQSAHVKPLVFDNPAGDKISQSDKELIETNLTDCLTRSNHASYKKNGIQWNSESKALTVSWNEPALAWDEIKSILQKGTILLNNYPSINPLLLTLDTRTLDTQKLNTILTQDLTTCVSLDPKLDREMQAVYHFVVADQNRGKTDFLCYESSPFNPNKDLRSPLLISEWMHRKGSSPSNPMLYEFTLDAIASSSGLSPAQKDLLNKIHNQETLSSQEKDLAKDVKVKMVIDLYTSVNQAVKNELYLKTASDPDFTLYTKERKEPNGRSFFQMHPDAILNRKSPVDIYVDPKMISDYFVRDGSGEEIAEVFIYGNYMISDQRAFEGPETWISEDKLHLAMKPKKPFLPTTNENDPARLEDDFFIVNSGRTGLQDIRELKSYDAWHAYVEAIAGEQVLSIPSHVLENMFRIRLAPADNRQGTVVTSYSSDTALRALEFMCDTENQPYIQHDFVQNYLLESLFGPMVLQQTLMDHPEAVIGNIQHLQQAILQAQKNRNHDAIGLYSLVLNRLEGHINEARDQLHNQGILAGSLSKLPNFRDKRGLGAIYRQTQRATNSYRKLGSDYSMGPANLDKYTVMQPLVAKLKYLEECHTEIETAKKVIEAESEFPKSVKDILLSGEEGKRPIDKITDPGASRRAYTHLLQHYRSIGFDNLDATDRLELLKGYEILRTPPGIDEPSKEQLKATFYRTQTSSALSFLEQEAVSWIRQDVLPAIEALKPGERDTLLKQIINIKLKADGQPALDSSLDAPFKSIEGKINQFKCSTGIYDITFNLSTMEIGGIELTKKVRGSVGIPQEILKRNDVRQALGTSVIEEKITKTEKGAISTYSWTHQGQLFSLRTNGSAVEIKRKIDSHPQLNPGEYTFYSVELKDTNTHAAQLLNANGIWKKSDEPNIGYVFGSGMKLPIAEAIYRADIRANNTIAHLSTLEGARVGTATRLDGPSPVLFADTKNTLILVDQETGRPNELRLPALNMAMVKQEDRWQLTKNGKSLGVLKVPDKKEENALRAAFGEHWDQFVIPMEKEVDRVTLEKGRKVETKSIETAYLMIPYRQQVDRNGRISADQATLEAVPDIHEIRMTEDGKVEGSMAANVYLAHRFLLQTGKTSNPTLARNLMMKAQAHLERVMEQPAPKQLQEVENLGYVLNEIAANPAISVRPPPTLEALSMALRLELFTQHIRTQARRQSIKTLQVGSEQELNELSKISRMYQAHTVLWNAASKERKLHKEMFALTDKEVAALAGINNRMLQQLSAPNKETRPDQYFGATGRLATTVTMERPQTIEPQFLLALLRMAKPRNQAITLKGVNAPLPAGDLIENFWSYLTSIKEEGLTPEDLMFLFEESVLPPTDSPEQEQQLHKLDLQARQFLLSMSDLMQKAGKIVDPMGEAKEQLGEKKAELFKPEERDNITAMLEIFKGKPGIGQNFRVALSGIDKLVISAIPDTDPPMPDLDKLVRDLNNDVKTPLENYRDEMDSALSDAEKLISESKTRDEELSRNEAYAKQSLNQAEIAKKEAMTQLEEEYSGEDLIKNQQAIEEEYNSKIEKLKQEFEKAERKHQTFKLETVRDPLTGGQIPLVAVVSGDFAETIQLEKLKNEAENARISTKNLDKAIYEMRENADLLKQWNALQECMRDIETVQFKRNDWFNMPESGAAKALIEYQIMQTGKQPSLHSAGVSLIKQLGPITAVRLAKAASNFESLNKRLQEIDEELSTNSDDDRKKALQDERAKTKSKLLSNPLGNLEAAGKALGPFVVAGAALDFRSIECRPADGLRGKVGEQSVTNAILDDPLFQKCFTANEKTQIADNLSRLDGKEQKTYVQQLQSAIKMQASLLEARTGLQSNLDSINASTGRVLRDERMAETVPVPHDFEGIAGTSLAERYQKHYTGKAGFSDRSKLAALFTKLEQKTVSGDNALAFLKNRAENLADPMNLGAKQHAQMQTVEDTVAEIRKKILPQPIPTGIDPYIDALALIGKAATPDYKTEETAPILESFAQKIVGKRTTGEELLLYIQDTHDKLAPHIAKFEHLAMVEEIVRQTMPEDSHYGDEYHKGFEKVKDNNPLAYSNVIGDDQVERVEKAIASDVVQLQEQVKQQQDEIVRRLEAVPLGSLPRSVQKIRMRRGSRQELLQAAYKEYRKGAFQEPNPFKPGAIPEGNFLEHNLDALIGKALFDDTCRQVLQGSRFNASNSVQTLYRLREEKKEAMRQKAAAPERKLAIQEEITQKQAELDDIDNWKPNLTEYSDSILTIIDAVMENSDIIKTGIPDDYQVGEIYFVNSYYVTKSENKTTLILQSDIDDAVNYIKSERENHSQAIRAKITDLQRQHDHFGEEIDIHLAGIESQWQKESDKIRDFTDRCQSQPHLQKDLESLAHYTRHINYLQQRMGIVLRDDQIQTLKEIIDNPALLKQLRMGLGKTSVILPFALMILSAKGNNAIGMVPKALFDTNFDEMDETTRTVFEMAGSRFLFARQDASLPLNKLSLHELSTKSADFFNALDRGEYILTTIESKASLDNKIIEVERSQAFIQSRIDAINENKEIPADDKAKQISALYPSLCDHQMALDMLYRVKAVFEAENTRLIIDEVDSVAKSNKTVNSEIGSKSPVSQSIQNVAAEIFDVIRTNSDLTDLFTQMQSNNQFTLDEKQVNQFIKGIGTVLIKDIDLQGHDKDDVLDWLAGEAACPFEPAELSKLGADAQKLKIQRKALNSALRSSLGLKAGLSADFDPTHGAIGIPASQGVTSKTTKFSDPLMQVVLTQMIALYKPQGETYLNATAREVISEMKTDLKVVESQIAVTSQESPQRASLEQKQKELKSGIEQLSKLVIPGILRNELKQEIDEVNRALEEKADDVELTAKKEALEEKLSELDGYISTLTPESSPSFQEALAGHEPLKVFLRLRFAQQAAKRGMIYLSSHELARPNQHALRGCNVIGLTGTATENTSHVITGTGHHKAMEGIRETGRDSTAEVVYRFVKALKKGSQSPQEILQSPVQTYSLKTDEALLQFIDIARTGSGYRFLINQAGACDELSLRQITEKLHQECRRPIIYLDMDEEGRTEKVALINNVRRPLKDLSPQEKRLTEEEGFTYYHTPHVRGTHFDLPGSKGAIMLSPTVNANDRDQAFYRARGLGEEHVVEPFISEKQSDEFHTEHDKAMSLGDLLKVQHEQTRTEESQEDLSAYVLHIKGQVVLAADKAKRRIQLEDESIKSVSEWADESDFEANQKKIAARVKVDQILEKLSIRETGNEAYMSSLDSEIRQGGAMKTDQYLRFVVIEQELTRAERYLKEISEIDKDDNLALANSLEVVKEELTQAEKKLTKERDTIESNWNTLSRQLPLVTSSAPATQETAETEAEAEAEAVAETTAESESEKASRKRAMKTRNILTVPDYELLNSLEQNPKESISIARQYSSWFELQEDKDAIIKKGWKDGIGMTANLRHTLDLTGQSKSAAVKALVVDYKEQRQIIMSSAAEADKMMGHMGYLTAGESSEATTIPISEIASGFTVKPWFNEEGEMELQYCDTTLVGKSQRDDFDNQKTFKGELYLSFIHAGFSPISSKGWSDIEEYWKSQGEPAQDHVKLSLENTLKSSNPALLDLAAKHLWDKPDKMN